MGRPVTLSEIGQQPHGLLGPVQARQVLQGDDDHVVVAAARAVDQLGLLVHPDDVAVRQADAVVEAEATVAGRAGDERLAHGDPLRRVEQRDEVLVAAELRGIESQQFAEGRRDVQRATVHAHFPVADPRDALGEQQLGAARAQLLLQRAVAQQEAHALDQQARVHALLREIGRAGGERVADRGQVVAAGQHQDRHQPVAGQRADLAAGLDAGQLRHHHVEDDAVGLHFVEAPHGLLAVRGRVHEEPGTGERRFRQQQVRRIVVGDQEGGFGHALVHSWSFLNRWRRRAGSLTRALPPARHSGPSGRPPSGARRRCRRLRAMRSRSARAGRRGGARRCWRPAT